MNEKWAKILWYNFLMSNKTTQYNWHKAYGFQHSLHLHFLYFIWIRDCFHIAGDFL